MARNPAWDEVRIRRNNWECKHCPATYVKHSNSLPILKSHLLRSCLGIPSSTRDRLRNQLGIDPPAPSQPSAAPANQAPTPQLTFESHLNERQLMQPDGPGSSVLPHGTQLHTQIATTDWNRIVPELIARYLMQGGQWASPPATQLPAEGAGPSVLSQGAQPQPQIAGTGWNQLLPQSKPLARVPMQGGQWTSPLATQLLPHGGGPSVLSQGTQPDTHIAGTEWNQLLTQSPLLARDLVRAAQWDSPLATLLPPDGAGRSVLPQGIQPQPQIAGADWKLRADSELNFMYRADAMQGMVYLKDTMEKVIGEAHRNINDLVSHVGRMREEAVNLEWTLMRGQVLPPEKVVELEGRIADLRKLVGPNA